MAGFTLDEVRDTYPVDMSAFIAAIDEGTATLLSAQALSVGVPRAASGDSLFEALGNHGHAIYGSSSLVGLESMMGLAKAVEALAAQGHQLLGELEARVSQVRAIATQCQGASQALKQALALELQGNSAGALAAARAVLPMGPGTAPPPVMEPSLLPPSREFDFEDDEAEVPVSPQGLQDELLGVFRDEAREFVAALQTHLKRLSAQPDDGLAASQVERIYHTLKGAAATVGLTEVASLASALQVHFEELIEGRVKLTPPLLGEVFRTTNRLLRASALPEISLELLKPEQTTVEGDRTRAFFLEEAQGIASEAQALVEALRTAGPERREPLIKQLKRLFHGLKGSALLLGDQQVAEVAIALHESARAGVVAELQEQLGRLNQLIEDDVEASSIMEAAPEAAEARPHRVAEGVVVGTDGELWDAFLQECQELVEAIDKELFALEASPTPKAQLQALFRHVHTLKGALSAVGVKPTAAMLHHVEDFLEKLLDAPILPSMKNVATFMLTVQEEVRLNLRQAPSGQVDTSHAAIAEWAARVTAGGGVVDRPVASGSTSLGPAPDEDLGDRRFIRVAAERIDELMNLAGELVVSRSRLTSRVGTLKALHRTLGESRRALVNRVEDFRSQYEFANLGGARTPHRPGPVPSGGAAFGAFSDLELDRYDDVHILARGLAELADDLTEMDAELSRELGQMGEDSDSVSFVVSQIQNQVTRTRMLAVDSLFARLRLPIRDAAAQQGKQVEVNVTDNDVALDKTIIDALYKPMLHLVRNAVFHGLENEAGRVATGKPTAGLLSMRARQEAGQIVIEVEDDGKGLDLAALKARGVAAGLVNESVSLDDPAVANLVFAQRISTAEQVGAVAGRGVGGEVVKRAVERLNGHIRVDSRPHRGTLFTITLPMTLLITPALLFKSGGKAFAVPLFFAERIIEVEDREMVDVLGKNQLKVGDQFIPVRRLEQVFGQGGAVGAGPVVVLRIGERRLALQVDVVQVREEVVVKNLGRLMSAHPLFAGVTIRGSGELVLILDVPGLLDAQGVGQGRQAPVARAPAPRPVDSGVSTHSSIIESKLEHEGPPVPDVVAAPVVAAERKVQVLFVDDSLSVRKVAERALQELGVEVTLAVDGLDAIEKLRRLDVDLVFTDLEMPRMHGFDLIREMRFLPRLQTLPVVVISSRSGTKHQDQARALGATDYLTKPFTSQVLEGVLSRLVPLFKSRRGS